MDPRDEPATKGDLQDVQTALTGDIQDVRSALKGDIHDVRTELKGEIHELRVLVEAQQDWPQRILEAMQGMEARLRSDFEKRFARIEVRLDVLEQAVRETSERVRENRQSLEAVSADVAGLRVDIDTLIAKADVVDEHLCGREARVEALERRVSALEARLTPDD